MTYTFITFKCENCADCIPICPVVCISRAETAGGTRRVVIDDARCVDCDACLSVCPIEGAVINYWDAKATGPGRAHAVAPSAEQALEALTNQAYRRSRFDFRMEGRLRLWQTDCATRVVSLFEYVRPSDAAVRRAVLAAREYGHALGRYGCAALESHLTERPLDAAAARRLDAARARCVRCGDAALAASRKAGTEAARLAAEAAAAACKGWNAAHRATRAIAARPSEQPVPHASATCDAETQWQLERLITRLSARDIEDWPLPATSLNG